MMLQVFAYAIAVAAVLSVVGICAERFARLHRLPRRTAWAAAMLLSVLLPAGMILIARPPEITNVPYIIPEPAVVAESSAAQLPAQATSTTSVAPRSTWKLPRPSDRLLITMWMATSSVLALYLLGANLLLRRRMKGWHNATVQDHQVLISEVTGPALLGALSPRIVVPRWLLMQPHGTQALILQHEQQHVVARDALLIIAGLVAIVAVPWNLPLWWQWRRMRQAIELDCDARVLGAGAEAKAYAEVLLAITQRSTRVPAGALAMSEPVHALERRIASLMPDAIRFARLQAVAVLLLAAAGAGAALALEAPALLGRTVAAPLTAPQGVSTPAPAVLSASPATVIAAVQSTIIAAAASAPRAVEPAPAARTQAPAQPATKPVPFKEGEYIFAAVTRGNIEDLVTATGTLTPRESADVSAQVSGRIEKLHVEVGDEVKQGDVLAEIDVTTAIARGDGVVVGLTKITAPMGGTVMKIHVKQGQTVDAAQDVPVMMQIANLSTMTVAAAVSEVDVTRLFKGIPVYFTTLGANGRRWYGELKRIEPTPKVQNGVVRYNALFDVQNVGLSLIPQMTAQVYFVSAEARNVLRVPVVALAANTETAAPRGGFAITGSGSASWVVPRRNGTVMVKKADSTLETRQVVVGATDRVHGEVLEGLKEGEEVVVGRDAVQQAVFAVVKRLAPEVCEVREIRLLSAETVEILGQCATPARISDYYRNLARAGGKPEIGPVEERAAGGYDFRMRLSSLQAFASSVGVSPGALSSK
jgi:multidrug efflux pump subunit AcrA (membrane-fusion protein)/beta-lactamase regulating signal transducer with metallopeptidase domain